MPLPVFVLNLPRDSERREAAEAELARVGLAGEVVAGVDGSALTDAQWARYDRQRCRAVYGVDMLPSELGCYLGHEAILRRILDEGHEVALILEDDIRLSDALMPILRALLSGPRLWLVVRLAGLRTRKVGEAVRRGASGLWLHETHALYRLNCHVLGAQGYVISREGAQRMLDYGRRIVLPWDHAMDRFWENGIHPFVVHPFPVTHREDLPSIIGARDPRRRYDGGVGLLWRRRLNRWQDGLAKRWYIMRHWRETGVRLRRAAASSEFLQSNTAVVQSRKSPPSH